MVSSKELFSSTYLRHMQEHAKTHPEYYHYGPEEVPVVHAKMMAALERGSANKDSEAIKATCKEMGIKHTYRAIRDYLSSN